MDRRWERRIPTEKVSRWQKFVNCNLDDFFSMQSKNTKTDTFFLFLQMFSMKFSTKAFFISYFIIHNISAIHNAQCLLQMYLYLHLYSNFHLYAVFSFVLYFSGTRHSEQSSDAQCILHLSQCSGFYLKQILSSCQNFVQ